MSENKPKLKTRCYYTEYVNHMIRFYLTCPETLNMDGKRAADISNWLAVQSVMHHLSDEDREKVIAVFKTDYRLPKAVETYCAENNADEYRVWKLLTKVLSRIAHERGLI